MDGSPEPNAVDAESAPPTRARVIVAAPIGLLDYRIPEGLEAEIRCGVAVRVFLGKRPTSGYVAQVVDGAPAETGLILKDLIGLDTQRPPLPVGIIHMVLFAAAYYAVAPGEMLAAALPAMARPSTQRYVVTEAGRAAAAAPPPAATPAKATRGDAALHAALAVAVRFANGFTTVALERDLQVTRGQAAARLKKLCARNWLTAYRRPQARARTQVLYTRCVADSELTLPARQRMALALLARMPVGEAIPLTTLAGWDAGASGRLRRLITLGLVSRQERPAPRADVDAEAVDHAAAGATGATAITPTADQAAALEAIATAIDTGGYAPFLLLGVTGSGKTEVYLQSIARALQGGKTALVLVPEIALTPQLGARFAARFGQQVAIFHSGLTVAERREGWERVARGEAKIGLGARSALFLPLENIGVIIVDEEHETSFKQDESPRYNARDLALWRGKEQNAVVILGSATPSLESHANAVAKRYTALSLPHRVANRPMPPVDIIDLAHTEKANDSALTLPMAEAMEATFLRGEQAILFLNRRGYAPYIFCRDCGHSYRCDDCDVALTLHRRQDILLCHYCGQTTPTPEECHGCHGLRVGAFGLGTERLDAEVHDLFPGLTTARLDRDTIKTKADLERTLRAFRSGKTQLLLGTQMVAKGHDFANVTMVGVIAADASLNFPDFRAAERTFQLLTQVAGRAGRGERPGRVLVQAYETEHYAIQTARTHDYAAFVEQEMQAREELRYPPFTYLAQVRFEGEVESQCLQTAEAQMGLWRARLVDAGLPVSLLGPAIAPLARLRGLWRVHALLKADTRQALRQAVRLLPPRPASTLRRILDVDPISML
jgi:primosomal protein N' (replication factor Y)